MISNHVDVFILFENTNQIKIVNKDFVKNLVEISEKIEDLIKVVEMIIKKLIDVIITYLIVEVQQVWENLIQVDFN